MDNELNLDNVDKLEKFFSALSILQANELQSEKSKRHMLLHMDVDYFVFRGRREGELMGRLVERFANSNQINFADISDILSEMQQETQLVGLPTGERSRYERVYAVLLENAEKSFDIAANDKLLPPISAKSR